MHYIISGGEGGGGKRETEEGGGSKYRWLRQSDREKWQYAAPVLSVATPVVVELDWLRLR